MMSFKKYLTVACILLLSLGLSHIMITPDSIQRVQSPMMPKRSIAAVITSDEAIPEQVRDDQEFDLCKSSFDSLEAEGSSESAAQAAYNKCRAENNFTGSFDAADGIIYPWWSEISPKMTAELESKFDVFILINTQEGTASSVNAETPIGVPRQHARVVIKKKRGTGDVKDNFFKRDSSGVITGIDESKIVTDAAREFPGSRIESLNVMPDDISAAYKASRRTDIPFLIPSTTGKEAGPSMKTINGIYNVNVFRSEDWRIGNPEYYGYNKGMSFPLYVETTYKGGVESGIAIHGTPGRAGLGGNRGSHGCARVHPNHAEVITEWVLGKDYQTKKPYASAALPKRMVPKLNWKSWKAYNSSENEAFYGTDQELGVPVVFIIFNGYDPNYGHAATGGSAVPPSSILKSSFDSAPDSPVEEVPEETRDEQ